MANDSFIGSTTVGRSDSVSLGSPSFFTPGVLVDPAPLVVVPSLLERTEADFEDVRNPAWRLMVGAARRWMTRNGSSLLLTPRQACSVTVGYQEAPAMLALDADIPDSRIPLAHHSHLAYAAAAFLLRMDGDAADEAKAQSFMQTFNSLIEHTD